MMYTLQPLTVECVRHALNYDPLTGVWTWRNPHLRSKMRTGDIAGRITNQGRRQIRLLSGYYYSARLAWFYMTGEWPKEQIDHINRLKADDRWENLREATQSQNSFNRAWAEVNGSMRGIRKNGDKYAVSIGALYQGSYETLDEAMLVRDAALAVQAGCFVTTAERATR